jgi:hypothetical protein
VVTWSNARLTLPSLTKSSNHDTAGRRTGRVIFVVTASRSPCDYEYAVISLFACCTKSETFSTTPPRDP